MENTILTLFSKIIEFIKKNIKICIIIFLIIVVIISIFLIISRLNNNKIGNSTSNLYNSGIATIEDSNIYYTKIGEEAGIYKIKQNKEKSKKLAEGIIYYLNLYKDHLYYIELNEKDLEFNIIKLKANGKERETFLKNVDLNMLTVAKDWVYYFQDKELFRIKINGKDKMKVCENEVLNYRIEGNYIYYIYNNGEKNILARKTLEGKNFLKLSEGITEDFEIIGNKIYYIEEKYNSEKYQYDYALYRMKTNGKSRKQILALPSEIRSINITGNAIYYVNSEEEIYNIYQHKYKEDKPILLKEIKNSSEICVVGNWVYYIDLNENGEKGTDRVSNKR